MNWEGTETSNWVNHVVKVPWNSQGTGKGTEMKN